MHLNTLNKLAKIFNNALSNPVPQIIQPLRVDNMEPLKLYIPHAPIVGMSLSSNLVALVTPHYIFPLFDHPYPSQKNSPPTIISQDYAHPHESSTQILPLTLIQATSRHNHIPHNIQTQQHD